MLTLEKLAEILTDMDFDRSPQSERYQVAYERQLKELHNLTYFDPMDGWVCKLPVTGVVGGFI